MMARRARIFLSTILFLAAFADAAAAHTFGPASGAGSLAWAAFTAAALALAAIFYAQGLRRLWARAGAGAGIRRWQAAAFAGGWLSAAAALLSPLDQWGEELFSAHMVQHEILMLVSAPLIVLGRPAAVFLWAFSPNGRRRTGRFFSSSPWLAIWRPLTHPLGAWTIYATVLWAWHAPVLFEAATVRNDVHALQHATFFGAALLFWWAFLDAGHGRSNDGIALVANFTTAVHSSLLGALLTFASSAWYSPYLETAAHWGLTPLEDQQLGGLIMWVPGGLAHLIAGLVVGARWIGQERRGPVPDRAGGGK